MHNNHKHQAQPLVFKETARQLEICNACRYCEGYCSVFPAMFEKRTFSNADITQLANLCHNCRGCYYACQYTEPHEFQINIPKVFAEVRQTSWQFLSWPAPFARLFHKVGLVMAALMVLAVMCLLFVMSEFKPADGDGFYAYISHKAMVLIFMPAFVLPLLAIVISLRHYWRYVGGGHVAWQDIYAALRDAGSMKNLTGGHGEGCNFEDEDRFSNKRRIFHQLTLYGFLLCFASTSVATLMHYLFDMQAPYNLFSLPKLLGVPGGIVLCVGTLGLAWLKTQADVKLDATQVWGGEMAFVLLLFTVSFTGLVLYGLTDTSYVKWALLVHLACVLVFFLLMPYSKMVHGFYRLAALVKDATHKK